MIMPTGPLQFRCRKCSRTQWSPGYSDVVYRQSCQCGSTDFELWRAPIPKSLWQLARAVLKILPKR